MTIRRDDLVAAAAVGLLQYRQIDPLLVFLLQRDVRLKRMALIEQAQARQRSGFHAFLSHVAALLAVITASLFGVLFTTRSVHTMGFSAVVLFTLLYGFSTLALAFWFKQRGYCARVRVLSALIMTSVPLAVFALQQVAN
ncbi:MAG TPA: hypothetical protein VJ698_12530 [Noviherbaspirillum sp.]|uniref:hypothetical protein n=1 Tax=Noviherbaspirillum sp. TaxID=1926288 RepID=UPI002B494507|nr:hypothetical protein [Noviherbaspirillum sp.]HJV86291.1 hypothetical protein [Noviherbaspirillum sp.]